MIKYKKYICFFDLSLFLIYLNVFSVKQFGHFVMFINISYIKPFNHTAVYNSWHSYLQLTFLNILWYFAYHCWSVKTSKTKCMLHYLWSRFLIMSPMKWNSKPSLRGPGPVFTGQILTKYWPNIYKKETLLYSTSGAVGGLTRRHADHN